MRVVLSIFASLLILGCGGGGGESGDGSSGNQGINTGNGSSGNQGVNTGGSSSGSQAVNSNISDEYFSNQWYLARNNTFYNAYNINQNASIHAGNYLSRYNGKGVKVVVIDDGLDVNHKDLRGNITGAYDLVTGQTDVSQNYGESHGTEVTGVIAAKANNIDIYGIAHGSNVYFMKYKSSMTDSETIKLFRIAENTGADIINCSWGTGDVSESVKEYMQYLANNGRDGKGTLIVFASGNENQYMGNDESAIPEVISVGATNAQNLRTYSHYGPYLDVVAPGGDVDFVDQHGILTLIPGNRVAYTSGTSFSAPLVSGMIALMLEANPNLTRDQVENILTSTADKVGNQSYTNGRNNYYGYGKVNLSKAINAALSY